MTPQTSTEHIAVRNLLSRINDAWLHQQGEPLTAALERCFAEEAVMRGPDFALVRQGPRLYGAELC